MSDTTAVPGEAHDSKARANALFKNRDYASALNVYEDTLLKLPPSNSQPALAEFARTVVSNKAACYIELRRYDEAVNVLEELLALSTPESDVRLTEKAYFRLAKCHHNLKNSAKAIEALDNYRRLHGRTLVQETPEEETLHLAIFQSTQPAGMKAFKYAIDVSMHGPDSTPYQFKFYDSVPAQLCVRENETRLRDQGLNFLKYLTKKYDTTVNSELQAAGRMFCWHCGKPATSAVHTPASWLCNDPPFIMDWAQPVCSRRGVCEQEAFSFMAETMTQAQSMGR